MAKVYLEKDVLTAFFERCEEIFKNADNVIFSVSGGKDSGISCNITREHPAEIEM